MKTILTLFAMLLSTMGYAQHGFFFRAGFGYAVPQAGQTMDATGSPYNGTLNNSAYPQAYKIKSTSFSAGVYGTVAFGYLFNDHIGVQLDVDAGISPKKNVFHAYDVNVNYSNGTSILSNITVTEHANMPVVLAPALLLQSGGNKVNIYSRFGPAFPLMSKITEEDLYQNAANTGSPSVNQYTYSIKNSFSLGLSAAAGAQYKVNTRLTLWAEVSLLSMSLYIKQSDLTAYAHNGHSYSISSLSGVTTYYYSKNAAADSNGVNRPTYSQPFSNVGLKVGICLKFRQRSHGKPDEGDNRETSKRPKPAKFR